MKTAVSIPDDVFEQAEQLARRRRISRSELYATALKALLADDAAITDRLNEIYPTDASAGVEPIVVEAARRTMAASDW